MRLVFFGLIGLLFTSAIYAIDFNHSTGAVELTKISSHLDFIKISKDINNDFETGFNKIDHGETLFRMYEGKIKKAAISSNSSGHYNMPLNYYSYLEQIPRYSELA